MSAMFQTDVQLSSRVQEVSRARKLDSTLPPERTRAFGSPKSGASLAKAELLTATFDEGIKICTEFN